MIHVLLYMTKDNKREGKPFDTKEAMDSFTKNNVTIQYMMQTTRPTPYEAKQEIDLWMNTGKVTG